MATETGNSGEMPEPDITTDLSIDEVCEVLNTEGRRNVIEQIAMHGWPSIDGLDPYAVVALEEYDVVSVRGRNVGRGENYEATLRALNAIAKELRDLR